MRVEVLGGIERRRRWSRDDKMRIIEETLAPGAVVTEIARRHGIATSLVFTWRRRARLATVASTGPGLVPVQVAAAAAESARSIEARAAMPARKRRGLIEIGLGDGLRVGEDDLLAFTDFGIESLIELIKMYKDDPTLLKRYDPQ
jgi:transposase